MRTKVKICGITHAEDAESAMRLGVDAIGLVFYASSPRAVSLDQARAILRGLPPFVTTVGLFVNPEPELVIAVLDAIPLDRLQFHGAEPPEFCRRFGRPYIKAIPMRENLDIHQQHRLFADASALLVDTYQADLPGGTGISFNWSRLPRDLAPRLILAGGLTPDNVEQAIRLVGPYAVDVSSGVERSKGLKDEAKMSAFMRGVERGDSN